MNGHGQEDFIPYLDGRLSAAERDRLDNHLAGCPACRTRLEEMRALFGVLEQWKAVEPSPGFDAALRARLGQARQEEEKSGWPGWLALRPTYAGALALAILLAVGISLWQPGVSEPESPEPVVGPQVLQTSPTPLLVDEGEDLAVLENSVLLENYELLEEFDILFEPLGNDNKTL